MNLEQVGHRCARRTGHALEHDKWAELGNLSGMDLPTPGIDRFHTPDSRTDDARGPIGLHVYLGKPGIAYSVERSDATVFGCFRQRETQLFGDGGAFQLGLDIHYRARYSALQAQALPLRHGAKPACAALQGPNDLSI